MLAPVEFEYVFENFLRHEHPESQVSILVCWDFEEDPPALPNGGKISPHRLGNWICTYSMADYTIDVILLSKIPGLTVDRWSAS
jgi:hypothetical protein